MMRTAFFLVSLLPAFATLGGRGTYLLGPAPIALQIRKFRATMPAVGELGSDQYLCMVMSLMCMFLLMCFVASCWINILIPMDRYIQMPPYRRLLNVHS
jgi:hypothetical protein